MVVPAHGTSNAALPLVSIANFEARAPDLFDRLRRDTSLAVAGAGPATRFVLDYHAARLCLVDREAPRTRPFHVDLDRRADVGGPDLLRRAIGRGARRVIDATAGFGTDAVHLARRGLDVLAIERCEAIAALLADGLSRMADVSVRRRIELVCADATNLLGSRDADVAYLDPMYDSPQRLKSKPRRAMVLARELAGEDADAADLLALARQRYRRVVVKRADKSPPLAGDVHHAHRGRTVRYDVYIDRGGIPA